MSWSRSPPASSTTSRFGVVKRVSGALPGRHEIPVYDYFFCVCRLLCTDCDYYSFFVWRIYGGGFLLPALLRVILEGVCLFFYLLLTIPLAEVLEFCRRDSVILIGYAFFEIVYRIGLVPFAWINQNGQKLRRQTSTTTLTLTLAKWTSLGNAWGVGGWLLVAKKRILAVDWVINNKRTFIIMSPKFDELISEQTVLVALK